MMTMTAMIKFLRSAFESCYAFCLMCVVIVLHPFGLHSSITQWGSTDEEIEMKLPGDDLLDVPGGEGEESSSTADVCKSTFAITIDRPPSDVWPWIVQLGVGRAGMYSYDCGENMLGCGCTWNADCIVPEWQTPAVGDTVYLAHPNCLPSVSHAEIRIVERDKDFVWLLYPYGVSDRNGHRGRGMWAFHLISQNDDKATRLLNRISGEVIPQNIFVRCLTLVIGHVFYEPVDFVMRRKQVRTIKKLAEASS